MTFNSGFAADSGVENFWNTSVDFGKLSGAAAVQRATEKLNGIKRESGTFNAIMGADAEAEMEKLRMQGVQAMHDANIFNQNLMSVANLATGGVKAFGNAGGFGVKGADKYGYDPIGSQGNPFGDYDFSSSYGLPGGPAYGGGRVPLAG